MDTSRLAALLRRYFPVVSVGVLMMLLTSTFFRVLYKQPLVASGIVSRDIENIHRILTTIDRECNVLAIKHDRNYVDFLTVREFVGSEVGPFNLAYPKKWTGPYLEDNPTIKGAYYEILRASDGFFIVPGSGVTLPSGRVMGTDIRISPQTRVRPMLVPGGQLHYKGVALAKKITFTIGDWDAPVLKKATIKKIDAVIKEFGSALTYTRNEHASTKESF